MLKYILVYPEKFKCIEANVYDIENINLEYTQLNTK